MSEVNIIPHIAHAIAMTPHCHAQLMRVYNSDRARYFTAAQKSAFKAHHALTSGTAEQQVIGLRALGVLSACNDDLKMRALFRSCDREIFDRIARLEPPIRLIDVFGPIGPQSSEMLHKRILFAIGSAKVLERPILEDDFYSNILQILSQLAESGKRIAVAAPTSAKRQAAKQAFGISAYTDMAAAADADSSFANMSAMLNCAAYAGLEVTEYTAGQSISLNTLAVALDYANGDMNHAWSLVGLMTVARTLQADREFCSQLYREDKTVDLESAKASLEQERLARSAAEARIPALESENKRLESELAKLRAELADTHGDLQELAALRSALYAAQADSPETDLQPDSPRALPDGIVALGGRDAWLREMRARFPSIRFIGPDQSWADADIRVASELWIQAGYIGHTTYYRAIDIVRKNNIPIKYFSSTGVARSVRELLM